MIRRFLLASFLISTLVGCNKNPPPSEEPSTGAPFFITRLQDIVGYSINCETPKGIAYIYIFSPHVVGTWHNPKEKSFEYFNSQFLTKNDELMFEASFISGTDLKPQWREKGNLKNRRIAMKFLNGKVLILLAQGLDEKSKKPVNPNEFECTRGEPIHKIFSR